MHCHLVPSVAERFGFRRPDRRGFTLIELLIVIAIILILIAIALPNFLEAQLRARVTKAKGEIRSVTIALESYYLDFKIYPSESEDDALNRGRFEAGLTWLTSPIAYLTSLPEDPFGETATSGVLRFYETGGAPAGPTFASCPACLVTWAIFTRGPDGDENEIPSASPHNQTRDGSIEAYAPTNGTKSRGDIFQYGGDPFWIGVLGPPNMGLYRSNPSGRDVGLVVNSEVYLHRLPPKLQ